MNLQSDVTKLGDFDISALVGKVAALPESAWDEDQSRQEIFEAHTHTQTIKLLFDPDYRHENPTTHAALDDFQALIDPFLTHIASSYCKTMRQRKVIAKNGAGYFIRIILTRLLPSSEITPHADDGYSLKRCHRIHVPIITNDQCTFKVGASAINMHVGEMWEINNRRVHAVKNNGHEARVHLIMDYVQPGEVVFDQEGPLTA